MIAIDFCVITTSLWLGHNPGPISIQSTPQLSYFLKEICSSTPYLKEDNSSFQLSFLFNERHL